jgi:hypothetical protein
MIARERARVIGRVDLLHPRGTMRAEFIDEPMRREPAWLPQSELNR